MSGLYGHDPKTPEEMRVALLKLRYGRDMTTGLLRQIMSCAEYSGLSGEDTYTMLAWHALCRVEELQRQVLDFINTNVTPPIFVVKS